MRTTYRAFVCAWLVTLLAVLGAPRVALADKAHPASTAGGSQPPRDKRAHGAPPDGAKSEKNAPEPPEAASAEPLNPGWKLGPQKIELGHELTLSLPESHVFIPPAEASKILEKMGNFHNEDLLGVVASKDEQADWFVTIRYEEEGYIKDDEKIDADELLSSIREGTEEANKERVEKGFKPLKIDGWTDPPRYERGVHHLVWALEVSDDEGKSINFNTRILGRKGYASINLVTGPEHLAEYKPQAAALLAASAFGPGARYEDFDHKTDKMAEYGLAGLVLGGAGLGAAKLVKIGLLAKFWKVIIAALIAGKKVIIVALLAVGAFVKKLFGGGKSEAQPAGGPPEGPPPVA
jgi:uncharacterized membrane-anchored protein